MAKKNKTGNFLKEIQKQSEEQRNQLLNEISAAKKEAVSKAEKQFQAEAEKYVAHQLNAAETNIKSEYAVKTLKCQGELFKLREDMTKKVFEKAKERLVAFSESDSYEDTLLELSKEIADTFNENSCVIYLKSQDMKFCDKIRPLFSGNVEFAEDNSIQIGGVKGFCKEIKIVADNTLDSKLQQQKSKFIETANLKIV